MENSLKELVYWGLGTVKTVKIILVTCANKAFESLTKKIHIFQRFKNFWCFRDFVMSYIAISERRRRQKI